MFDGEPVHEVEPAADDVPSFQIDSDEYDSEASVEDLDAGEYDRLVEEGTWSVIRRRRFKKGVGADEVASREWLL